LLLLQLLSDLIKINDVLFIVKRDGAVSEIRSNSLCIRKKEKWIPIGDNNGPAHMHIDSELIKSAEFVLEEKPHRTSFSVRFFNNNGERVLAAFFTKMYDESKKIVYDRKKAYNELRQKYPSKIQF
jgi:putative heme iron utilization protein